jgi:adenylylsulfate kinase-like enzyme
MTASFNPANSNMSPVNGNGDPEEGSVKEHSWVLFVSGKSSVARFLASRLGAHYLEGDNVRFQEINNPKYEKY